MPRAKELYDQVRATQEMLGGGEVEEALERAEPLLEKASTLVASWPQLTSFDRTYAGAAVTYAAVVMILGLGDSRPPAEAVPRIRDLAAEAVRRHRPKLETWKPLGAAAEMLARAGDAEGAVWAIRKAEQLGSTEDYVGQLAGSIRAMYPQVFAEAADPAPDEPPPLQPNRR